MAVFPKKVMIMEERDFAKYAFLIVAVVAVVGLLVSDAGVTGFFGRRFISPPFSRFNAAERCQNPQLTDELRCNTDFNPRHNPRQILARYSCDNPRLHIWQLERTCPIGEVCYRNECRSGSALGAPCDDNSECASGICGRNQNRRYVCEEPNQPVGNYCGYNNHAECASGICGLDNQYRYFICENPNPLGAPCEWPEECVSEVCGVDEQNHPVCENQDQPLGARCNDDGPNSPAECGSGICGPNEQGRFVCEEANPLGARCSTNNPDECASGQCVNNRCA